MDNPETKTKAAKPVKFDEKKILKKIDDLENQLASVTGALEKIATVAGQGNNLKEFGLSKWQPSKADMNKYKEG